MGMDTIDDVQVDSLIDTLFCGKKSVTRENVLIKHRVCEDKFENVCVNASLEAIIQLDRISDTYYRDFSQCIKTAIDSTYRPSCHHVIVGNNYAASLAYEEDGFLFYNIKFNDDNVGDDDKKNDIDVVVFRAEIRENESAKSTA